MCTDSYTVNGWTVCTGIYAVIVRYNVHIFSEIFLTTFLSTRFPGPLLFLQKHAEQGRVEHVSSGRPSLMVSVDCARQNREAHSHT